MVSAVNFATLNSALAVIKGLREYIAAIPEDVVAQLPAMPGLDGDWMDSVQHDLELAVKGDARRYSAFEGVSGDECEAIIEAAIKADKKIHRIKDADHVTDVLQRPDFGQQIVEQAFIVFQRNHQHLLSGPAVSKG